MQAMVLEISRAVFAKRGNFQILDIAQIKKFQKYDPPKVGVSKANYGVWGQRKFLGAPQNEKKNDFIKNLNSSTILVYLAGSLH